MRRFLKVVLISLLCVSILLTTVPASFAQKKYKESPMSAELVKQGKLPPVEQRLPQKPLVIKPVEKIGKYGGTWRLPFWDAGMGNIKMIMYDPPLRWNMNYTAYIPNLVEKWEFTPDGKTITFYFRKGVKWSDGHPFTMEDLKYWWEDEAMNKDYQVVMVPWWAQNNDRSPATVKFIDDYTISFTFKEAHWNVPYILASGFWEWEPLMKPKHYLSQFHPKYNPKMKDYETLRLKSQWWNNPDFPTLFAWHCVKYEAGKRVVFERNHYYWKVDTAGNQLPYIDRIEAEYVVDAEVRLLKVLNGEYDATFRGVDDPRQIPVLMERAEKGGYRVILWKNGAGAWPGMIVNQNYNVEKTKDPWMRDLLRNRDFRAALSLALDRDRINKVIWKGIGRVQQGTISEESWHFQSPQGKKVFQEWANNLAKYDPAEANRLLDKIGLTKRDAEGFRTRPDGKKLEIVLDVTGWGGIAINTETAPIIKKCWEDIGLRVILNDVYNTPEEGLRDNEGTYMIRMAHTAEMDLWTYPDWVFPGPNNRAWPLVSLWIRTGGAQGEKPEPGSPEDRLLKLYQKGCMEKDLVKRHRYVWEAVQIHIKEGPFFIGITGGLPMPVVVKKNFRNVPDFGVLGPWAIGGPGNTCPEQYFFE